MLKKIFDKTLPKFLLVGVINTLFGAGIMFLLYNLCGTSYWFSSAANYVFGSILSYFLNKHFTFRYADKSPTVILRFVLNILVCYLAAYGMAKPLCLWLLSGAEKRLRENIAMAAGMVLFTSLNYLGQKFFAFKKAS